MEFNCGGKAAYDFDCFRPDDNSFSSKFKQMDVEEFCNAVNKEIRKIHEPTSEEERAEERGAESDANCSLEMSAESRYLNHRCMNDFQSTRYLNHRCSALLSSLHPAAKQQSDAKSDKGQAKEVNGGSDKTKKTTPKLSKNYLAACKLETEENYLSKDF